MRHLSPEDLDQIARELDAIGDAVRADLGTRDATYIRRVVATQRGLEVAGRALVLGARWRPAAVAGAAVLAVAKALENMEIGHNVMHGQYDFMNDPAIHSTTWEWDAASTAESWKHSHNFQHHTYTNVLGKDRDLGYSAMRVDPEQPWHPVYLLQPLYGIGMALTFQWGIALYDMELDAVRDGRKTRERAREEIRAFVRKAAAQVAKDYVVFPALAGRRGFRRAVAANLAANAARNVWVHTIVFMGHIPEPASTFTFTEEEFETESRGGWYVRQLLGSCNLEGSPLFHVMTGNLSHQIEHHLFPDIPASRYASMAPQVRAVCERWGLPYHSGRLGPQYRSVGKKILRLSFPGGGGVAARSGQPRPGTTPDGAAPAPREPALA
ncbi:fatty acid desaturase family protein [Paraconexibacter algicola]|uniref:Acyl-CoA desaturase n=1 Tax=Paraconexibacter algicola TaxID=2133960 RepID=A0A2T4ULL4_9ACTN|nr:acyl-CoA desaturase [Paraconexibacter algicola]PTL60094.1 acyl-CoA desaturase [Paraconexibacter algicola]